jgi:hypothetical protein
MWQYEIPTTWACTVLSTALRTAVRFVSLLHESRFGQLPLQCFLTRRSFSPQRNRSLVTAFYSPATAAVSLGVHSRVKVPGLLLRSLANWSACPFGFSAPQPSERFAPLQAASLPQTRRLLYLPASPAALFVSTPLRGFTPLRIEAFNECRCLPVHLPNPPDLRSLPAAFSIARCQLRINVPGPPQIKLLLKLINIRMELPCCTSINIV